MHIKILVALALAPTLWLIPNEVVIENPQCGQSVKEQVQCAFPETPIMLEIARCESQFRQFKDGNVLRGELNADDVGVFQINEHYHLEASKKMGLDIHTTKGNIDYAKYLYQHQGTTPWNWSKNCWNNEHP